MRKSLYTFLIFLLTSTALLGQTTVKKIEVRHADELIGSSRGAEYQKLIGNVVLYHEGALMYCDSAYNYKSTNSFKAYHNVRIVQGDSLNMKGDFLDYDGNKKLAHIRGDVHLTDKKMTIYTNHLFYDRNNNLAYYNEHGKIVDSANTLTSGRGQYYTSTKDMYFKDSVTLVNKDFTLSCDTLKYNVNTKIATFLSPTTIKGDDTEIYTEAGWYNTQSRTSEFRKNAYIFNEDRKIYGDLLYFENESKYARAKGHVIVADNEKDSEVRGHFAEHFDDQEITYVTDSAVFIYFMKDDTMYLHADTLKVIKDSSRENEILLAYYKVRAFSNKMQLKCDSLSYYALDSMMRFYRDPVLWNEQNQITSTHISISIKNEAMDQLFLRDNCLLIEQVDSIRFNQIRGRTMDGFFTDNDLTRIDVKGNAESIYFLTDDEEKYVGMNRNQSSYIRIQLENKKIKVINFIVSPTGKVYPPRQMDGSESKFENFIWRVQDRPANIEDIF